MAELPGLDEEVELLPGLGGVLCVHVQDEARLPV